MTTKKPAKKAASGKTGRGAAPKKTSVKKTSVKKTSVKKTSVKKTAAKKTAAKKPAAKKPAAKKPAAKKPAAKKPAAKKVARTPAPPATKRAAAKRNGPTLEQVWEYREETLYPHLFGKSQGGIYPLTDEAFAVYGARRIDPRWLHLGVIEFAPTSKRRSWLYATSGGSTPWDTKPAKYDPDDYSWLGVELVFEAPQRAPWAILLLQRLLAFHVLAAHGAFGDDRGLGYGSRMKIGRAIDGRTDSALGFIAIGEPSHYAATQQLPSGKFDFLHVVGITEAERDHAKATSTRALVAKLEAQSAWPVTDPRRRQIKL